MTNVDDIKRVHTLAPTIGKHGKTGSMVNDETKMVESIDPEQRRVARSYAQFPFPPGHSNRSGSLNVQEAAAIRPVIMTAVRGQIHDRR